MDPDPYWIRIQELCGSGSKFNVFAVGSTKRASNCRYERLLIYNCNTYLSTFILRNLKDLDQILLLFHLNIISIYFTKICFLLDTVL